MKVGDLVWVKPLEKMGVVSHIQPPIVQFPAEFIKVDFFDGTKASDFLARMLTIISEK